MKRFVYRIQDNDGRGPWRPGFSNEWLSDRTESEYEKLAPFSQLCIQTALAMKGGRHIGFGCASEDQLRLWVLPEEYRRLVAHGYEAVKLDADAVLIESEVQLIFARSRPLRFNAEMIRLYPISQPWNPKN